MFTDADGTYAVVASFAADSNETGHFLRVAAKTGTLFVEAIAQVADPDDYRAVADRLIGYVNRLVAAQKRLGPLSNLAPPAVPGPLTKADGPAPPLAARQR